MTKMSKAERAAILRAYEAGPGATVQARDSRTLHGLWLGGWTDVEGRVTLQGLIEAGVDMAAVQAEAKREDRARDTELTAVLAAIDEVWQTINAPEGFRPIDVRPLLDQIKAFCQQRRAR